MTLPLLHVSIITEINVEELEMMGKSMLQQPKPLNLIESSRTLCALIMKWFPTAQKEINVHPYTKGERQFFALNA